MALLWIPKPGNMDLNSPGFYKQFLDLREGQYKTASTLLIHNHGHLLVGDRTKKDILYKRTLTPIGRAQKDDAGLFLRYYLENGPDGVRRLEPDEQSFLEKVNERIGRGEELPALWVALLEARQEVYRNFMRRISDVEYIGLCTDTTFGIYEKGIFVPDPFVVHAFSIEYKGEPEKTPLLKSERPELDNIGWMPAEELARSDGSTPLIRAIASGYLETPHNPGKLFKAVV
ncbi:MAG: hypothetical protein HYW26_01295 [Candidatus Aenigmarchaeota archaeon]|nr:hypothetical protein [Candidatus Aenigmarchaeota archaeon]